MKRIVCLLLAVCSPALVAQGIDYMYPSPQQSKASIAKAASGAPSANGDVVTYTSMDSTVYSLKRYDGLYTSLLMQPATADRIGASNIMKYIDRLDLLYTHFKELVGAEPSGSGLTTVAIVKNCGSGCGWIGMKGIEIDPNSFDLDPALQNPSRDIGYRIATHEFAHNYDLFSGWIHYGADASHAWTDFAQTYINVYDKAGTNDKVSGGQDSDALLRYGIEQLYTPYFTFSGATWTTCVRNAACAPGTMMHRNAQGGLMLKMAQLHGATGVRAALGFLRNAIKTRNMSAAQMTPEQKNDLLLEGFANGLNTNVSCYADALKWTISPTLRNQLNSFGPNARCADNDHDGHLPVLGDTDDNNAAVNPGAVEVLNGIDDDSNAIIDDLSYVEAADFPNDRAAANTVNLPSRITGAITSGDADHLRIVLSSAQTVAFTLRSPGSFKGWVFVYEQNSSIWKKYAWTGQASTTEMRVDLGPGIWNFSVELNNDSAPGPYSIAVNTVQPWPALIATPAAVEQTGGANLLTAVPPPAGIAGAPGLTARFWVSGRGWVATNVAATTAGASYAWLAPGTQTDCSPWYRSQYFIGDSPATPPSVQQSFTIKTGTACGGGVVTPTRAPFVSTLAPESGAGVAQTYSVIATDPDGATDVSTITLLVGATTDAATGCRVEYNATDSTWRLGTANGAGWSAAVPSGVAIPSNGRCALGALTSALSSASDVTLTVPLTFSPTFAGAKNVFVGVRDDAALANSDTAVRGRFTVTDGPIRDVVGLTPLTGSGSAGQFTGVFTNSGGPSKHYLGYILFLPTPNVVNYVAKGSCLVEYNRFIHGMRLIDDPGTGWLGGTSGIPIATGGTLSNSQCTLNVGASTAQFVGNQLIVTPSVTFKSGMTGVLGTFIQSLDVDDNWTGMTQMGNWLAFALGAPKTGPYVVGATPLSGRGKTTSITATAGHTAGSDALGSVHIRISSSITQGLACHLIYSTRANSMNLVDDSDTGLASGTWVSPGMNVTLSNSRCSVPATGAGTGFTATASGNTVTFTLPVQFTDAFTGQKKIYVNAFDAAGNLTHWVQTGTWTVE